MEQLAFENDDDLLGGAAPAPPEFLANPLVEDNPLWTPPSGNIDKIIDYTPTSYLEQPETAGMYSMYASPSEAIEYGTGTEFDWGQKMGAFLETENTVGSWYERNKDKPIGANDDDEIALQAGWTSVEAMDNMGITDPELINTLIDARFPRELDWKLNNWRREKSNRYIMEQMTFGESLGAGLMTAVTDPLSWAMTAIPFIRGGMAARAAYGSGIAASEATIAEVLLHTTQTERTLGESFLGVGATAIFGGVLGPLAGKRAEGNDELEAMLQSGERNLMDELESGRDLTGDGALSADKTYRWDPDADPKLQMDLRDKVKAKEISQEDADALIKKSAQRGMEIRLGKAFRPIKGLSPLLYVSLSKSLTAQRAIEWMSESSFIKNKHFQGIKSRLAIDTKIKRIQHRMMVMTHNAVADQYKAYAKSKSLLAGDIKALIGRGDMMSLKEFKEEVGDAYGKGGVHENEFVAQAAKNRKEVWDVYEKELVAQDLLVAENKKARDKWQKQFDDLSVKLEAAERELEHTTSVREMEENTELLIQNNREKIAELKEKISRSKSDKMIDKHMKRIDRLAKESATLADRQLKIGKAPTNKQYGNVKAKKTRLLTQFDDLGDIPAPSLKATVPFGEKWYMPRIFIATNVAKYEDKFVDIVVQDWLDQASEHLADASSRTERVRLQRRYDEMKTEEGMKDLHTKAREAAKNITGQAVPHLNIDYIGKTNVRKKHRTLRVRSDVLKKVEIAGAKKPINFIETDIMSITRGHLTAMTPELVLKKEGFDMERIILGVEDDYRTLRAEQEALGTKKSDRELRKLIKEEKKVKDRLIGVYQTLNNDYRRPSDPTGLLNQARLVFQQYNIMRMLGSMTISAITDLGNFISHVGLRQFAGSFRTLSKLGWDMTKEQSRKMGLVAELVTASRLNALAMSDDFGPNMGAAARFMANRSREFSFATAMNHWNAGWKELAILAYSDEIVRTANRVYKAHMRRHTYDVDTGDWYDKTGKIIKNPISKNRAAKFAANGLDEQTFTEIAGAYAKYGQDVNGVHILNIDKWVDDNGLPLKTAENLMDILMKQADMAIVTPGSGDLPLMMRTPVGSVIGQFKSFSFTAINRIMIPNMQRLSMGDPSAAVGMAMQFGLGTAVYGLKMHGMGREDQIDTSWQNLVNESFMRSGYFGILADVNAISHKLSRGQLSVAGLVGGGEMSRYFSRSFAGDIIGPSFSTLQDAGRMFGSVFSGDFNKGDLSAARRMMPYQNLYWIRRQLSNAEEWAAEEMGL